jgi:hypothetical protein
MTERKMKFNQELLSAQMIAETAIRRAEAAEAMQKLLKDNIDEARQIQNLNAQLHKDLAREQIGRKRLHNELEDLKGRIRIYVRIRPMSKKDIERGAEATFKDGKQCVLVKSKDGKKNYDFDKVRLFRCNI